MHLKFAVNIFNMLSDSLGRNEEIFADLIVVKSFGSLLENLNFSRGNFQLKKVFDFK